MEVSPYQELGNNPILYRKSYKAAVSKGKAVRPAEAPTREVFLKEMEIKWILEQWVVGTVVEKKTGECVVLFYNVFSSP